MSKSLYSGQESLILQSFVTVKRILAEYRRETNLPATSAQTDKQAWLQSAHGHEKRAEGVVPSQVERAPSAYRKRREVRSPGGENVPAVPKETRDPPRVPDIFTGYYGGAISSERRTPVLLCSGAWTPWVLAGRLFCQPKRPERSRTQPCAAMDERSLSEK